ncbi:MAG: efflux RND transporter periplasmic adaptor subunit [Gammaproteobacteria bacterium]|nr:efflux RND transporter periplasmic adaptor subunit [Gammaproteobacteria bacterium]
MKLKMLLLLATLPLALSACGRSEDSVAAVSPSSDAGTAMHEKEGEANHEEEGGHIELTAEQIKAAGIQLHQVGPAVIREALPLYGVIAPNAERMRDVAARFPGVIRRVAKKIGDPVREGEELAIVEANESLEPYAIAAPLAGVVTARNANPGEQTGDKTLFTVADLSTVWVELSLFPRDVVKVRVGQDVRVKSPDTGLAAVGKVVYVAPFGQAANQTITARVLLDNPDRRWAPGLYVTAEVTLAETAVPLAIRNEAVQTLEERSVVFVQGEEGFEPRAVSLGRSDGEFSEVLAGLQSGDTYAAANSFILKAELGKGSAEHGH